MTSRSSTDRDRSSDDARSPETPAVRRRAIAPALCAAAVIGVGVAAVLNPSWPSRAERSGVEPIAKTEDGTTALGSSANQGLLLAASSLDDKAEFPSEARLVRVSAVSPDGQVASIAPEGLYDVVPAEKQVRRPPMPVKKPKLTIRREVPPRAPARPVVDRTPSKPVLRNVDDNAAIPADVVKQEKIRPGDTLMKVLLRAGAPRSDAHSAISAMRGLFDPRDLKPGQAITVTHVPGETDGASRRLLGLHFVTGIERDIRVLRDGDTFQVREVFKTLSREVMRAHGPIQSSLYKGAVKAGVPAPVLIELMRIYSWDVDFQREVQPGDAFDVVFETFLTESGDVARYGNILYAGLTLSGHEKKLFRFEYQKNRFDYFNEKGKGAKKALMKTPIDGARLSSGFGKRRHPILGYNRMHKGVDFAAPPGTPIYAAGDGVVDFRGRKGGYGKYIRIRHNGRFSTAYAHMRAYKRGVTRGSRVRQGQVIGFVGSTGRSTGPHLHYEVLDNGRQINPLRMKLPSGKNLKGKALARFQEERQALQQRLAAMPLDDGTAVTLTQAQQ